MQNRPMTTVRSEIALRAARLVVEDGMDFGNAKRRAAQECGIPGRATLPDNHEMEEAVRDYLTQAPAAIIRQVLPDDQALTR